MSRKLLAFLLNEFTVARVICRNPNCRAVLEVPIEKLGHGSVSGACHVCNADFITYERPKNAFRLLAEALREFKDLSDRFEVELVTTDKTDEVS